MPSPVFTGDPPRPLFIPGGGGLVPALADDPCGCCEPTLDGLCCVQSGSTLTAFVSLSGVVEPDKQNPSPTIRFNNDCTCDQYNGAWAIPMSHTGRRPDGTYQFCDGQQCFPSYIDNACAPLDFFNPDRRLDLQIFVQLTPGAPAIPGRLACVVNMRWAFGEPFGTPCGAQVCTGIGTGFNVDIGPSPSPCGGLTAEMPFRFFYTYQDNTGPSCVGPACNWVFPFAGGQIQNTANMTVIFQ